MTYKQIEASREARLWIGQIIVPALATACILVSNSELRDYVNEKKENIKSKIKNRNVKFKEV